jgi:hypothetical protein
MALVGRGGGVITTFLTVIGGNVIGGVGGNVIGGVGGNVTSGVGVGFGVRFLNLLFLFFN